MRLKNLEEKISALRWLLSKTKEANLREKDEEGSCFIDSEDIFEEFWDA